MFQAVKTCDLFASCYFFQQTSCNCSNISFSFLFSFFNLFFDPKVIEWKNQINHHHKDNLRVMHFLPNNKDIHHHHHNSKDIHHHHKLPAMDMTITFLAMANNHHHHQIMAIMQESHKKKRYDLPVDGKIFGLQSYGCSILVHSLVFLFWPCVLIAETKVTLQAVFHLLPSILVSSLTQMPWKSLAMLQLLDLG